MTSTPTLPPELSPRRGAPVPGRPGRPARNRRLLRVLGSLTSALVFTLSMAGYVVLTHYDGKISRINLFGSLAGSTGTSGPLNILLVGSDSRKGLTDKQIAQLHTGHATALTGAGRRSDTMMLVHISGDRKNIIVVSLPRDSYVRIPSYKSHGRTYPAQHNKLNAAFAFGGPQLLIRTVQQATGVKIDHYVEIGFGGFVNVVDALGGVDVCLPYAVNDWRSGLKLPAGTSHVGGVEGLSFVRARYIDPTADLGRMRRQQQFMASVFKKATSTGTLLNPVTLNRLLTAALSSVTTDSALDRGALLDLATQLRDIRPSHVRFLTVPLSDVSYDVPGVGSSVLWNASEASALFGRINHDQTLTASAGRSSKPSVPASQIRVQALNGSSIPGLAGRASSDLARLGYVIADPPANYSSADVTTTVIRYDPRWSQSVKTLAAAFSGATLQKVAGLGATFQVVVGTDYAAPSAVTVAPKPASSPTLASNSAASNICSS